MESFGNNMQEESAFKIASEALLWRFIDGVSTETENREIEVLIASNPQWREKYAELLQLNKLLQSTEPDQPSIRFTKNVMEQVVQHRIASPARGYVNRTMFLFIGSLFLSVILVCFILILQNTNWHSTLNDSSGMLSSANAEKLSRAIFNVNHVYVWISLNVILGFYFISRYLADRRKQDPAA